MGCGGWATVANPSARRLERSYQRNLGHARFWAGVAAALLGAFLLFIAEVLWAISQDPKLSVPLDEAGFMVGVVILTVAFGVCCTVSLMFRTFYRRDDAALAAIEHTHQEATQ